MNEDLKKLREEKLEQIKKLGVETYPYKYKVDLDIKQLLNQSESLLESQKEISIAGRIMGLREQGKAAFVDLWEAHSRIQLYLSNKNLEKDYQIFQNCDIGDYIGVVGQLFKTRTNELSVRVKSFTLLAKSLQPFPVPKEKVVNEQKIIYDEFSNQESRYRKRYLDLILNKKSFQTFKNRAKIIKCIRDYLEDKNYIDVETPTLQKIYGGANAEPFTTKHNSLNLQLYLRISNELFLKRCIIGGFQRVYEIVKDFRNEGIDRTHNPEFTMVEFYETFADYNDMMVHFENIYRAACLKLYNKPEFEYDGKKIDLAKDWERLSLKEAIYKYSKIDVDKLSDDALVAHLKEKNIELLGEYNRGLAITKLFDESCPQHLINPVFIIDHPKESTPLCKVKRGSELLIERFEPYIMGWELGNAYSELTDPKQQRYLLEQQEKYKKEGIKESHPMDEDFIISLEYGMPPTGGVGLGIDRMVMLLTNQRNIRDVILFPLLK